MKIRFLGVLASLALISACTTTDVEESSSITVVAEEQVAGDPTVSGEQNFVEKAKDRIFFAFDKSNLSAEAVNVLKDQAAWLKANPTATAILEGNTDDRGTREYNLALGERRAVAAKNYLISRGIEASRLKVISYGKERPAVVGANEAAWAQNRRVVTVIQD